MIYVASPYSSPIPELVTNRVQKTTAFVDYLISRGEVAFSPVVYLHPIATRLDSYTAADDWLHFNMDILRRSDMAFFLRLPGWENSKGMKIERNTCKLLRIYTEDYDVAFNRVV